MKKTNLLMKSMAAILLAASIAGCSKTASVEAVENAVSADEKLMVTSAGFNGNWVEKTASGDYLVEGDILLTKAQLQEMAGVAPTHNFIVANEEHYRTY